MPSITGHESWFLSICHCTLLHQRARRWAKESCQPWMSHTGGISAFSSVWQGPSLGNDSQNGWCYWGWTQIAQCPESWEERVSWRTKPEGKSAGMQKSMKSKKDEADAKSAAEGKKAAQAAKRKCKKENEGEILKVLHESGICFKCRKGKYLAKHCPLNKGRNELQSPYSEDSAWQGVSLYSTWSKCLIHEGPW